NAIQSFGYGSEGGTLHVTEPSSTFLPPAPPLQGNTLKPLDSACMFSTCANLQFLLSLTEHQSPLVFMGKRGR
ncbi:hypothetical protein JOQ06_029527, partial [Pogonophryne albipinna]